MKMGRIKEMNVWFKVGGMESTMASIIMMLCIVGVFAGISAFFKSLGKKKFKHAFIWLGVTVASGFLLFLVGTSDTVKNQLAQQEEEENQQVEEDKNKEEIIVEKEEKQEVSLDPKDITKAECEQIKYHMTYDEVREIATYDAEITSSEQIGEDLVEHAVWRNSDGAIVEVVMKNKIVTNWWGVCERE
jgi:flagellar biosynthesis/type III secretory pathway M-ring protein FliF/YscJ